MPCQSKILVFVQGFSELLDGQIHSGGYGIATA